MLIKIWEHLRGYDSWTPAEAKVYSGTEIRKKFGKRYEVSPESRFSGDMLVWSDDCGHAHIGTFITHETSPLYQLLEGESIGIRYNPENPDRSYCRPHFLSWLALLTKNVLGGAACLGFIAWRIWRTFKHRGF
jgi:hypothetical protein